jgi:hypothetical protein
MRETVCRCSYNRRIMNDGRSMTTPDWLTQHGGSLNLGSDGKTWYVFFAGQPHYSLLDVPVAGKFGCAIRQTINGRRLDNQGTFATKEEAINRGLDDLRKALGWG